MDGTETLARHHRGRAIEGRAAHQDAIAPARSIRLAPRVNLEVERIVSDTTSGHVAIEAADHGVGAEERGAGSRAAGVKMDQAPRQRGLSTHGRGDAPPRVLGVAVTREGWPVRPGVLPGHTVEGSPGTQGQDDLRGGPLSRWVGGARRAGSGKRLAPRAGRGGATQSGVCPCVGGSR